MILKFLISPVTLLLSIAIIGAAAGIFIFLLKHLGHSERNDLLQNLEHLNNKADGVNDSFNNISAEYEAEIRRIEEQKSKKRKKRRR